MIFIFKRPPHELFPWESAMKPKPPQTPGIALGCPRSCFRSVVRSHRAVMQWRQPCSIHLCDEHGCIQPVDAGGETTRRREPRGVSGTLKVSPTGSIPHRENPAGKSPMTRSKPLGPSFASGSKHQREYGHGHASPDRSVETRNDQNQISQTQVHGTRGCRRRWHDRFRLPSGL